MAQAAMSSALQAGASAVNNSREKDGVLAGAAPSNVLGQAELLEDEQTADLAAAHMMGAVRAIGSALIGIAVLVVVLIEVFTLDVIANTSSDDPFGGIIDSLESTGAAALGLLVIGLLVLAANRVMGFFGGGGF